MKRNVLTAILILGLAALAAQAQETPTLGAERRAAAVDRISEALQEIYVFPEVAQQMDDYLHQRLKDNAYDDIDSLPAFTEQLTEDLQSISHDLHLRVRPIPPRDISAEQTVDEEEQERRYLAAARLDNWGFRKIERLVGGIGYLDLRGFAPAEHAGPTAIAAMNLLSTSAALIIDLRHNGGGSPSMIQLISSYFFDEPVHLNSFYIRREDRMQQFWTQAHVEGPRMTETPIYVLTSGRTFSAAEEFTYNLKNLERATIVGETTGGGAHPVDGHAFPELGIRMSLPYGRAINPITETNWEGTGVEPHISVPMDEALDVALQQALEGLLDGETDPDRQAELAWELAGLAARLHPVTLTPAELAAYAGAYGPRTVRVEEDTLLYQRGDRPASRLIPWGDDRFGLEDLDGFRIRFERDAAGKVVTLVGLYDSGREEPSPRTGD